MPEKTEFKLPPPPVITPDMRNKCERSGDYMPILFELYKYAAVVGLTCAEIMPDSPGIRQMSRLHFAILAGLLNRCCRLMLANVKLSHDGLYAETTHLIDRCIIEAAVRVRWLCLKKSNQAFNRYLCDGLKAEVFLLDEIRRRIKVRNGVMLNIEKKMINSCARFFKSAQLREEDVKRQPKMPDFKSLCSDLNLGEGFYLATQRIGSHPVHGSWPDLMRFYLKWDADGSFSLRDQDARPRDEQFIIVPIIFLDAVKDFLRFAALDPSEILELVPEISVIEREIEGISDSLSKGEFGPV